ncbi:protein Z-dependent protease inhibitor isoform X2 [Takifugu rubripes]|uniref:Serpin family A member 10 n=2 Tax=Takifugu rubripes TaxID=31033 RepID=H2SQI5_TAKRU|nr:protein Z-dependent protease inhibitor isoform X2 [Takifugu rubripes]
MFHKMKMGFIFFFISAFICAYAQRVQLPSATISDLSFKNMDFAMNLYRTISSFHDKNIFFSPLSISTSFAALLMASDGVTYKEILEGLNLHQLEQAGQLDLIPGLFKLLNNNITQNGSLRLDQGMALFMHPKFRVEKTFQDQLKTFFDADIKSVNFTNTRGSVKFINEYIKRKSHDKISNMVSSLDPMTGLMLTNTIFFQGSWELPFNPNITVNAPFYIDNYSVVQVPMMFLEDKFYMMVDTFLGVKVLKLPYKEGVSMLIVLPNKNVDYTETDDEITADRIFRWTKMLRKVKLEVHLPKFKMEHSYSLHEILPDMGMASVFDDSANLSKLSKDQGIKVSEVLHKAVIEVDETGTTAAAATIIGITPFSLPRTFTVNRPFFFFIYHEKTNCMLFMGRVIDPTKN